MPQIDALHGDGINFAFYDLLWSKCSSEEKTSSSEKQSRILRLPDTVLFLFGQPHQWYFTSKNGGPHRDKTTILRKRKANLTLKNIEEVFLSKASSKGGIGNDEVLAYFINTNTERSGNDLNASMDSYNAIADNEMSCNIEYFDKSSLHDFLTNRRHNKSGILQRFIAPHGGTHNSTIRAVWTPKLCVLERRRTKQCLYDKRFALYERVITFDGPAVHSVRVPLRGSVLAERVENISHGIVKHITDVMSTYTSSNADFGVGRIALNYKVDGNGKIWILWSDSIRLSSKVNLKATDTNSVTSRQLPLKMDTMVRLPSAIKLSQIPSHKTGLKLENKLSSALCPSCGKHDTNEDFQKVPYKTVVCHFEKTLDMLKSSSESDPENIWPPEGHFIKAAGDVGFGTVTRNDRSKEALCIPPLIRHIHPKLQLKGYQMYRKDPLFLKKTCDVCQDCYLAYAKLKESSFLMVLPIDPYHSNKELHHDIPANVSKGKPNCTTITNKAATESFASIDA